MIAYYTGGVFAAVLILLTIVFSVEKCRKKTKRITEVVELKPVDADEPRKITADRNAKERTAKA